MSDRVSLTSIAEDIYQLRLPLPFALNHVNVYLLRGSDGWTIVDCGINWEQGRLAWEHAFAELDIADADIAGIVLTHVHPDHFGLAGWLQARASAAGREVDVIVSPREAQQTQDVWLGARPDFHLWLADNGMSAEMAHAVDTSMGDTHTMTLPHPHKLILHKAGEMIRLGERHFMAIHAPGHSDGQLLFYHADDQLLLSADHVLMTITPNIGLWETTDSNPLGQYMASLRRLSELDVRLALPGHRGLIEDWAGRIAELLLHHEHRLGLVIESLANGWHTPFDVAQAIFETERFTAHEWRFAMAETLSHLDYLRIAGKIQQDDDRQLFSL
ncbi:MAG: MBL fold metallo-hydrolase [Anaerolineae bacterium]